MNVPPASTYRSRIANEVASSVAVPKCIVPRLSTLTSRRVFGSVPIVRYFMRTSLDAGAHSRSNRPVCEQRQDGTVAADLPGGAVRGALPQPGRGDRPIRNGTGEQLARLARPGEELPA